MKQKCGYVRDKTGKRGAKEKQKRVREIRVRTKGWKCNLCFLWVKAVSCVAGSNQLLDVLLEQNFDILTKLNYLQLLTTPTSNK